MRFLPTRIPDVVVVEPTLLGDERGFFMETWHQGKFADAGLPATFVQDNHSGSRSGILRGLHYQAVRPQGKLVRVTAGTVFDVAVDLRQASPTFGRWVGEWLSSENRRQLWVPPGFAHGFLVRSDWAEVMYKCTELYAPEHDRAIAWDDPELAIAWPLEPGERPLLSAKDAAAPRLAAAELFI